MKANVKDNKIYRFLFLIVIIFAAGLVHKTFQNDTFYTIKIGESILKNGIDMLDHFSFHGLMYTYPHWLYDVFIYLIYHLGGYHGIYISTIILDLLLLYLIYRTSYKLTDSISSSFISTMVCALIMGQGFATARAQLVSYSLFVLEIYFIEMLIKTKNKKYIIGLLLISLLLCNIHVAVWPFYYILYLPYICEWLVSIILKRINPNNKCIKFITKKIIINDDIPIKPLLLTMGLSLFTGLLTPIKDTPYTYLYKTMIGNSQKYIEEHQMVTLKQSIFTIAILVDTFILAILNRIKLRDLSLLLGLALMSILSARHIGLFTVITLVCFARTYHFFLADANLDIDKFFNKIFSKIIVKIISLIVVIVIAIIAFNSELRKPYVDKEIYPVDAVKYIKKNIDVNNMRIFNEYNFGSYLLLNDIPVFIDSRADLYTKQFSGLDYDIFDDYMHLINYNKTFDFYNISHILTYKENLYKKLKINDNYNLLYEDEYFAFFERVNNEEKN